MDMMRKKKYMPLRLDGPQCLFGHDEGEKYPCPLSGIKLWFYRLKLVILLTELYCLQFHTLYSLPYSN
jgi:hypothetical protein